MPECLETKHKSNPLAMHARQQVEEEKVPDARQRVEIDEEEPPACND